MNSVLSVLKIQKIKYLNIGIYMNLALHKVRKYILSRILRCKLLDDLK